MLRSPGRGLRRATLVASSALSDETRAMALWEWAGQDGRWARTHERLFALRIHWEPAVGDYCVDE